MRFLIEHISTKQMLIIAMAAALSLGKVGVEGWAETSTDTIPAPPKADGATQEEKASVKQEIIPASGNATAKQSDDKTNSAIAPAVTILRPAAVSSYPDDKGAPQPFSFQERANIGMTLFFLGAIAEEGS